jgi:RecQ family ATP-dependent DNA helicase
MKAGKMNIEQKLLHNKIEIIKNDKWNVLVLKGFSVDSYKYLKKQFIPINSEEICINDKIDLKTLSNDVISIVQELGKIKGNEKRIILFETFLLIAKNMNLNLFSINFTILTNNFVDEYENPSNFNVIDYDEIFDNNDFPEENDIISTFYSSSKMLNNIQYIEYVDGLKDQYPELNYIPLIEGSSIPKIEPISRDKITDEMKFINIEHSSFTQYKHNLLKTDKCDDCIYVIDDTSLINESSKHQLSIFMSFLKIFNYKKTIYKLDNRLSNTIRSELFDLLNKYWESTSFRKLEFYEDPDISKKLIEINQGDIIETIIQQCENGINKKSIQSDIFLTAPTGSGKSLLFQLPAIYLAEKYNSVTIVISPLIALMKDQVENLKDKNYENVAFINSELSLIQKEDEINKIHDGLTNIIYLSPELLLSYDLKTFLGERELGLLVIDEAHLVTTWGRDFRIDYWYLGNFIRKVRKYSDYRFTVLGVTATAVYEPNGINDMVFQTLDSLSMNSAIKYIGKIKRNDISFEIDQIKITRGHEETKIRKTASRILDFINNNQKAIVYCPWRRQIAPIRDQLPQEKRIFSSMYFGGLDIEAKELSYQNFKNGETKVMISTKAFGMGIDIDDITIVYHHAPSGHLSDYVQEIGRLARRSDLSGSAIVDFNAKDLRFSKVLFSVSSIRQFQIRMVLQKLSKIYNNKKRRNMLVTVDDFNYIFNREHEDIEQKVKSSLLLLEKDLINKYQYNVLIVRPRSLFTSGYIVISNDDIDKLKENYLDYIIPINNIRIKNKNQSAFILKLDKLWEDKLSDLSFPMIKKEYFNGNILKGLSYKPQFKIHYTLDKGIDESFQLLTKYFNIIEQAFSDPSLSGFFTKKEFIRVIKNNENPYLLGINNSMINRIADLIINIYSDPGSPDKYNRRILPSDCFIQSRRKNHEYEYRIINRSYPRVQSMLRQTFYDVFKGNYSSEEKTIYVSSSSINGINKRYKKLAYILETFNLGSYEMSGGEIPAIFIRINDPVKINWLANNSYSNRILTSIKQRHDMSMNLLEYFFNSQMNDQSRWEFIEDYFLGKLSDQFIEE